MSPVDTPAVPPPDRTARDAHGRMVAVDWEPARGPGASPGDAWLVAVDGTEGSTRAAAMAARLAARDARGGIDLVYVHPWLAKEAAETELARRGWHATAAARAIAESAGAPWRVHVRMGEAADRILALAVELGSLGIVIGSHGPTPAEAMLLGSVAYKVVNLGRVPVLVVR